MIGNISFAVPKTYCNLRGRMFLNRASECFFSCSILSRYSFSMDRSERLRSSDEILARKIVGLKGFGK